MIDDLMAIFDACVKSRSQPPRLRYRFDAQRIEDIPPESLSDTESGAPIIVRNALSILRALPPSIADPVFRRIVLIEDPSAPVDLRVRETVAPRLDAVQTTAFLSACLEALDLLQTLQDATPDQVVNPFVKNPVHPYSILRPAWLQKAIWNETGLRPEPRIIPSGQWPMILRAMSQSSDASLQSPSVPQP